ncbi:MAG TPA: VTT domain-containing protein [Candidatus Dormibacteraeota bacterium]|jgi:membrane-associated protein|nr:VTT domain-containing protein [Candidatus Dormibacteraeota bacterium]
MPDPHTVFLPTAQGVVALLVLCALLLAEEAGVPILFAPGEVVLIGAGLLIASGALPWWVVGPATYLSAATGAMIGFGWSRGIGPERLRSIAERFHALGGYERVFPRLQGAGALQIAISRMIPGLRIYTSLVAGAVHVEVRRFVAAVLPAIAVWVTAFLVLGVFVGPAASHLFGEAAILGGRGLIVLAIFVCAYLVLRRLPRRAAARRRVDSHSGGWRLAAAFAVDLGVVGLATVALAFVTGLEGADPGGVISAALVVGSIALVYMLIARRGIGYTVGEAIFRVHYP